MQEKQLHPLTKFFGQNWLEFGKFGWIWAKLRRYLGKIEQNLGKAIRFWLI